MRRFGEAALLTFVLVFLMILAVPAEAVLVTLNADKTEVQQGDTITFNLVVKLSSPDQYVPVEMLSVNLTGAEDVSWFFYPNGTLLGGDGISVTPSGTLGPYGYGYGYAYAYDDGNLYEFGYGYGYGDNNTYIMSYTIAIDSSMLDVGDYVATAYVYTGLADKPYFTSAEFSFSVVPVPDTTPPAIEFIPPTPENMSYLATSSFTVRINASEPLAEALLELDGTNVSMSGSGTVWEAVLSVADGVHEFRAWGRDEAGNWGVSELRVVVVDTAAPQVVLVPPTPADGAELVQSYIPVNATAVDANLEGVTLYLYGSGGLVGTHTCSASPCFFNFTSLAPGVYMLNATASDRAGNVGASATRVVTLLPTPTPPELKREAIDILSSLRLHGKSRFAIGYIRESLSPEYWVDEYHLDPEDGEEVFENEQNAAELLLGYRGGGMGKRMGHFFSMGMGHGRGHGRGHGGGAPQPEVLEAVKKLTEADELLVNEAIRDAELALQNATDPEAVQDEIDLAYSARASAYGAIERGSYAEAIGYFQLAWEHAQHAIKLAKGEEVEEEEPEEPGRGRGGGMGHGMHGR